MRYAQTMVLVLAVLLLAGCTEQVPPGTTGMLMGPGGIKDEVLEPGNHTCYGRDRMVLVESREETMVESLSVLCADDLNFKFNLKVRCRTKALSPEQMKELLKRQGAKIKWEGGKGTLAFADIYNTYIRPDARSAGRAAVSKHQTTQIRENRAQLQKDIQEALLIAVKDAPIEITGVVTSNFDYPAVITQAVEKKRKKEIEIDEEKAKQAIELLRADNRLKLAERMKVVRAAEAEGEAIYNQILAKSLTPAYLNLRQRENEKILYENAGRGDKIIIIPAGGGIQPMLNIPSINQKE